MAGTVDDARKRGGAAAMLLAGAVCLLALPSAVLAFSSKLDLQPVDDAMEAEQSGFLPAEVDPRLARSITVRALSKGRTFRFTPAATPTRMDRQLTVAVRLNSPVTRQIVVRGPATPAAGTALSIAPTAYSLGAARGYKTFAQTGTSADARQIDMPNLAAYSIAGSSKSDPARFAPRIELD